MGDGGQKQVVLWRTHFSRTSGGFQVSDTWLCCLSWCWNDHLLVGFQEEDCGELLSFRNTYPSKGDNVKGILSAINGIQEVGVGDLRARKNLQLTVETKGCRSEIDIYTTDNTEGKGT